MGTELNTLTIGFRRQFCGCCAGIGLNFDPFSVFLFPWRGCGIVGIWLRLEVDLRVELGFLSVAASGVSLS